MDRCASEKGFLVAVSALFLSFFLFSSFADAAYTPTIRLDVPVENPVTKDLGLFVRNDSMNLDFNLTFDYPFPTGVNESNITAEIWDGGILVSSKTIQLNTYLEKYGITRNGNYVYKPVYFNFNASVTGRNVSSTPISLSYTVNQYRRKPIAGEGGDNSNKWKIWGRTITGSGGSLANSYCSGPWDFAETGEASTCGTAGGGGTCPGQTTCNDNGQYCCGISQECCSGNCCNGGSQCCGGSCCQPNEYCNGGSCTPYYSFLASTHVLTSSGYKTIESVKLGDEVLSYASGKIVNARVSFVANPHKSESYFVLGTAEREVKVTGNHKFYTPQGYVEVSELSKGDQVYVLDGDKLAIENIIYKESVQGPVDVYDIVVEGTHTYFANGFAVHNDDPVNIIRGSYNTNIGSDLGITRAYQSSGPIIYFTSGSENKIKSTPGGSAFSFGWESGHSWKFETYVYPTITYSGSFNIYSNNGVRFIITNIDTASTQSKTCVNSDALTTIPPCTMAYAFSKGNWYKIEVYLYNNPYGDDQSNPAGVRIEDSNNQASSILDIIGGSGAVMNGEPPGADNVVIPGTETIYAAGDDRLFDIIDFTMFSTDHAGVTCDSPSVGCSLRMACGNSDYKGLKTNKYGWILNQRLYPETWDNVGGRPDIKEGFITTSGRKDGTKIDFDRSSIDTISGRSQYTENWFGAGKAQPIGGVYRCKKDGDWPYWENECTDPSGRYTYAQGSQNYKCCYVSPIVSALATVNYGGVNAEKDLMVRITNYNSYYSYIINFLPPYGNVGDKLCAIPKLTVYAQYPIQTLYQANYSNAPCNQTTGTHCCYCRLGWGCKMDCQNDLGGLASDKFTLPFPSSSGQLWKLIDVNLAIAGSESASVINLTAEGNVSDGWNIKAKLADSANLMLDRNYTIRFNAFTDFGLKAPEVRGAYTFRLKLNYKNATSAVQADYPFHASDCAREGDKRSFYNDATYPGTKGIGSCRPGLQTCTKISDFDLVWRYDSKDDMPVYPSQESCNSMDDDCNGIIDDIGGFDNIIGQVIASGGTKTPYQITKCGCFMGALAADEKCNAIDDDCDGVVDNSQSVVWANSCDAAVSQCIDQGSPYLWCKKLYNSSSCGLTQLTFTQTGDRSANTCTGNVRACMNNVHIVYTGNVLAFVGNFTYDECKYVYNNYSCFLEDKRVKILEDTCRCTGSLPTVETCNGIDDDCNGVIDDVPNATTCGCAMLTNISLIHKLKAVADTSCDGVDSNCNGAIDDAAASCACTNQLPNVVFAIRATAKELCNGVDDNCNGLVDETFPQIGKACGYGECAGGTFVCNAWSNDSVCNTTVTIAGRATKRSSAETCDLKDNDCDGSTDEGCACTPGGASKLCGYQNGIFFRNITQINQTCNQVIAQITALIGQVAPAIAALDEGIYEKCTMMLGNVSSINGSATSTILSLCDSIRICNKTDFPVNAISQCSFGLQTCSSGQWGNCSAIMSRTETCNGKDDDCNGIIDDVAFPAACACYNGAHAAGELNETCNGVDDNCNEVVDDVSGANSTNSTHCGCFNKLVNITMINSQTETGCNAIDDNCNGVIDEGVANCACNGTVFGPGNNTLSAALTSEKCNGVDDNCNNVIDDPWRQGGGSANSTQYLGATCGPQNSRCSGGAFVCSKNGNALVCNTMSGDGMTGQSLRANESCNTIDDDCNGVIDDVWGNNSGRLCQCFNGVPLVSEFCNGKDNDCNGLINDGLANCGCSSFGLMLTAGNVSQLSVMVNTKKSSPEVCNNIDDNCNNVTDEGLNNTCFCDGGFASNPALRPEFCNGVDDNCNAIIDDVANPQACACLNGTVKPGQNQEICNGVDDNCNGLVDENWQTLGGSCGLGACSGGSFECTKDGKGTTCSTGPGGSNDQSKTEICGDGIDNDCDGVIDEGCACDAVGFKRNCSINIGECRIGIQTCTVNGWSGCIGGVMPSAEICDGKDNNCDSLIDNVPNPSKCACYNGAHAAGELNETCNGVDDNCDGVVDNVGGGNTVQVSKCGCFNNSYAPGAKLEICNGLDDDCNGVIDDVKGGNSIASTKCGCYSGFAPKSELCNGVDDNCNGQIDETWPTLGQACGQGIYSGILACSQNSTTAVCNGAQPTTEICDGKDNDCDGAIDEGCFGPQKNTCQNGIKDGNEEGIDCGGSCPTLCKPGDDKKIPQNSWMLVFGVLVAVIAAVGVLLLLRKPGKQMGY
jgi:hypothetical protein